MQIWLKKATLMVWLWWPSVQRERAKFKSFKREIMQSGAGCGDSAQAAEQALRIKVGAVPLWGVV